MPRAPSSSVFLWWSEFSVMVRSRKVAFGGVLITSRSSAPRPEVAYDQDIERLLRTFAWRHQATTGSSGDVLDFFV